MVRYWCHEARCAMAGRAWMCRRILRMPLPSRFAASPTTGTRNSDLSHAKKLTAGQVHLVTEQGALAKPDIVRPQLAHGDRS